MQNQRGLIFIAIALLLGIGAAWMAQRYLSDRGVVDNAAPPQTASVVVARVDLTTASTLVARNLKTVAWPKAHLPPGALLSVDVADGRVLRRPLATGEPVLESALFPLGTKGGLGAVISPDHRAVSVKVDSVIGVAGFVTPGARVDVLATIRSQKQGTFSKVILQDVKVLAIDQKLEESKEGPAKQVNVVTLEVDTVQAEHLIYAAHEGRLQLALRTPGDDAVIKTKRVSASDLLQTNGKPKAKKGPKVARPPDTVVEVIKGSKMSRKTF